MYLVTSITGARAAGRRERECSVTLMPGRDGVRSPATSRVFRGRGERRRVQRLRQGRGACRGHLARAVDDGRGRVAGDGHHRRACRRDGALHVGGHVLIKLSAACHVPPRCRARAACGQFHRVMTVLDNF